VGVHPFAFFAKGLGCHKPRPSLFLIPGQTGYAPNGNILFRSDKVMGDWYFNYDAVDRLVSATPDANVLTQYQGLNGCWTYDSYGNRLSEYFSATPCAGITGSTLSQSWALYNSANNQMTTTSKTTGLPTPTSSGQTEVYDASGNVLFDSYNEYWYDAEGQLCAEQSYRLKVWGTTYQYIYDAEGARIGKGTLATQLALPVVSGSTVTSPTCTAPQGSASGTTLNLGTGSQFTTRWLVDLGGNQVSEVNGSGVWVHSNVFVGGRLMATYAGPGDSVAQGYHYPLTDWLGTKRMQTNASGNQEEICYSYPFGDGLTCTGAADDTEHHFTQKERDAESGLDYFGARYLNSNLGRFMTPDWAAAPTSVPYAQFGDPQSLNLYAYVGNNPNTGIDLDGHDGQFGSNFEDASQQEGNLIDETSAQEATAAAGETAARDSGSQSDSSAAPAQQQNGSSKGTSFWHGLSNLFHGHSWNYVKSSVRTETDLSKYTLVGAGIGAPNNGNYVSVLSPNYKKPMGPVATYLTFLQCENLSIMETITDEEDGNGPIAYGFINAGAAAAIKYKQGNLIGLTFVATASIMDLGAVANANSVCTQAIYGH
jgi:RHS repeat-associated protein